MIRENDASGLVHPEYVDGRRLWFDGAMWDLIRKLHDGDPTRGWEGDPRLAVYYDGPADRWEVMRYEHDGTYRMVCRSKPGVPFDERLIDALVAHDRNRGVSPHELVDAHNRRIAAEHQRQRDDVAVETAERLRFALRGEL